MSIWKCSNCGNEIPVNSKFCNHCGAQIAQSITCPDCGHIAPVGSRFCPECGHSFTIPAPKIDFHDHNEQNDDSLGWNFNDDEADDNAAPAPMPSLPEIRPDEPQRQAPREEFEPEPKPRRRSYGHIWAAILTVIILGVAAYVYLAATDTIRLRHAVTEIEQTEVELNLSPAEAAEVLRNTLGSESLNDVAFARQVEKSPEGLYQIAGLTYFTSPNGNSQLTAYTLSLDSVSQKWSVSRHATRKAQHYILCTDANTIFGSGKNIPCHVNSIQGKDYIFFAYALLPKPGSADASVILALYNVNTADIISMDYVGKAVERNGATVVMCQPINERHSPEAEFLQAQAQNANLIYLPTEADLANENASQAISRWLGQNKQSIDLVADGGIDVRLNIATYEMPLFVAEDANLTRIENQNLIIVATKQGAVMGYSKTKKRYFVVYAPRQESSSTQVRFLDDESVQIESEEVNFTFNPRNCTASAINTFFE